MMTMTVEAKQRGEVVEEVEEGEEEEVGGEENLGGGLVVGGGGVRNRECMEHIVDYPF